MAATVRKVEIPGTNTQGQLSDVFGAAPRPEDHQAFQEGLEKVERAERDAAVAGAQIRIH